MGNLGVLKLLFKILPRPLFGMGEWRVAGVIGVLMHQPDLGNRYHGRYDRFRFSIPSVVEDGRLIDD